MQHDRQVVYLVYSTLKLWPLLKCQLDRLLPDQSDSKHFIDSDTDISMERKREGVGKFQIAKNERRCGFQKGHTVPGYCGSTHTE